MATFGYSHHLYIYILAFVQSKPLYYFVVPTPTVNVIALSPPTVGQFLVLHCSITTVRGITSRVDITWRSGGVILTRRNITPTMMENLLIYTDYYGISHVLNTTDDGREFQCEVVINTLMTTGSVTLDVIGKYVNSLRSEYT